MIARKLTAEREKSNRQMATQQERMFVANRKCGKLNDVAKGVLSARLPWFVWPRKVAQMGRGGGDDVRRLLAS